MGHERGWIQLLREPMLPSQRLPPSTGADSPQSAQPAPPKPTFAGSVRPSEDGALLDLAKGLKEAPDVILALLLPQHTHKELPVF